MYLVHVVLKCSLTTAENGQNQDIFLEIHPLCESFHAIMAIIVIIITIRANHWSFQGENYLSVTCLSPGRAPKCPYYHHQGHSMWLLYNMCVGVCVRVCVRVTNPMTSYHILPSAPQRSSESVCIHRDKRARMSPPQGAAAATFHSVTGCSVQPEDICVSVWSPAGLSAKTSSQ